MLAGQEDTIVENALAENCAKPTGIQYMPSFAEVDSHRMTRRILPKNSSRNY